MTQEIRYSAERDTWNLFVDGEWYAEGDYEYCQKMYDNNLQAECGELFESANEDNYDEDWTDWLDDYDYSSNCNCDTYGVCSGTSCSQYFRCQA